MNLTLEVKDCIIDMLNNYKKEDYMSQNYKLVSKEPIGTGGFGQVFEVIAKQPSQSQHRLAMKKIEICFEENYSDESVSLTSASDEKNILEFVQCCQEAVLQSEVFDHPGIVKVHDKWVQKPLNRCFSSQDYAEDILKIAEFLQSGGQEAGVNMLEITPEVRQALVRTEGLCFYLIMDLYDMNLATWILKTKTEEVKVEIIGQIIKALHYIHSEKGYCHLDLTPSNIMVKVDHDETTVAIGDFGLSLLYEPSVPERIESRPGKPPYNQAPDEFFTFAFDIWSFGLIVYEILSVESPTMAELSELCDAAKMGDRLLSAFCESFPRFINDSQCWLIVTACLSITRRAAAGGLLLIYARIGLDLALGRNSISENESHVPDDTASSTSYSSAVSAYSVTRIALNRECSVNKILQQKYASSQQSWSSTASLYSFAFDDDDQNPFTPCLTTQLHGTTSQQPSHLIPILSPFTKQKKSFESPPIRKFNLFPVRQAPLTSFIWCSDSDDAVDETESIPCSSPIARTLIDDPTSSEQQPLQQQPVGNSIEECKASQTHASNNSEAKNSRRPFSRLRRAIRTIFKVKKRNSHPTA